MNLWRWNVWSVGKIFSIPIFSFFALSSGSCFQGCQPDILNPAGPTSPTGSSDVRQAWSPYVNIHPYGGGESQKPYLEQLIRAGALRGARVGDLGSPDVQQFAAWLDSKGVEVLGLFDNKYLRDPSVNQIFGELVRQNPSVRVWEIGNEVSGFNFLRMSPQEYVPIFKNLFYYARANNLGVSLTPQSDGLDEMLDAGLDQVIRDGLPIVTVHFYIHENIEATNNLEKLRNDIARVPGTTQVWITESGDNNWPTQASFVENNYPRFRTVLRAIRIYWYVLSECPANGGDFSLIKGLPGQCGMTPTPSPLFSALTNGGGR